VAALSAAMGQVANSLIQLVTGLPVTGYRTCP
jgi:hypothetical protein